MWLTAFLTGLAGSLHCAGMCSPLVMAVTRLRKPVVVNKLLYNAGRIVMYGIMGSVAGIIGAVLDLSWAQKFFSIAVGIALILIGFSGMPNIRVPFLTSLLQRGTALLKSIFSKQLQKKSRMTILIAGFLNGLLPCGLTYLALTYSLSANGPVDGFTYMVFFGAGTLPVMIGLPLLLTPVLNRLNFNLRKFSTVMFIAVGALLLARNFIHAHPDKSHHIQQQVEFNQPVICQ